MIRNPKEKKDCAMGSPECEVKGTSNMSESDFQYHQICKVLDSWARRKKTQHMLYSENS